MNIQFCAIFQDGNRIRQKIDGIRDMRLAVAEVKHQLGLVGTKCEQCNADGMVSIYPAEGSIDSVDIEIV